MNRKAGFISDYFGRFKKILLCFSIAVLPFLLFIPDSALAAETTTLVPVHSQDEIINEFQDQNILDIMNETDNQFDTEPDTQTFQIGRLSQSSLNNSLAMLNFMRYLAGLDPVTLDASYTEQAQAAAVLASYQNSFSTNLDINNFPGITADTFLLGSSGMLNSNFSLYHNIADGILSNMVDYNNYATMPKRLRILNPSMGKTGFGMCGVRTAVYATDVSASADYAQAVTWPSAGSFPYEFQMEYDIGTGFNRWYVFFSPWTIQLNDKYYQSPDLSQLRITVTNKSTGKQTVIEKDKGSDPEDITGFKSVGGCSNSNTIIFRPNWQDLEDYYTLSGSTINVKVEGLKLTNGADDTLTYDINFFRLVEKPVTGIQIPQKDLTLYLNRSGINLDCKVIPEDAENSTIHYTSSNENVAAVSDSGYVFQKSAGEADITAVTLDGGYSETIHITVVDPGKAAESVSLSQNSLSMDTGGKITLTADVIPADAQIKTVTWKSSDTSVATVDSGIVTAVSPGRAYITVTTDDGGFTATAEVVVTDPGNYQVKYITQIENTGWENEYSEDGAVSGTVGQGLRLEALKIKVNTSKLGSGSIQYKTHIQNQGWETAYSSDDQISGTVGAGLRLEAAQIKLTGELADKYDVYYCVHAQNIGWMGWAKNGESAGTAGYAYRLEGIKIVLVGKGSSAPDAFDAQVTTQPFRDKAETPVIRYRTHVQDYGWQNYASDGEISGTVGQAKRLEGIQVALANSPYTGNIEYQTHIQNIGWESSYLTNGATSGTSGKSLRLEAIRIRLTGEMAEQYEVYYCVHAENIGWMGWARNGEDAGTAGFAYRLEGIKILLVKKGDPVPSAFSSQTTGDAFRDKSTIFTVSYRTHVQDDGWQNYVENGELSGTTGRALRLEGINIDLKNLPYAGGIEYRTHVQNIGWQYYMPTNAFSGTQGQSLRLEAIQIRLTGTVSKYYDIYYQVHAENYGWLNWAKNDEPSGTAGYAYRLEAIRIKLVKKGDPIPSSDGGNTQAFYNKSGVSTGQYSRGEWIKELLTALNLTQEHLDDDYNCYFNDTEGSRYGYFAEIAHLRGIVPALTDDDTNVASFNEDAPADREFVAVTTAAALGYTGSYTLDCQDFSELSYPDSAAVIIREGYLNLENGLFNPHEAIALKDKNSILQKTADLKNDETSVEAQKFDPVYQDGVIAVRQGTRYQAILGTDGLYQITLPINDQTTKIQPETYFVLPPDTLLGDGILLKAKTVSQNDINVLITAETAGPENIYKNVSISGSYTQSSFEAAEGVEVQGETDNLSTGEELKFSVKDFDFGNERRLSCTATISVPEIKVNCNYDFTQMKLNSFKVIVSNKATCEVSVKSYIDNTPDSKTNLSMPIGKFSIPVGNGFECFVQCYLIAGANGEFSVNLTASNVNGFELKNNTMRTITDSSSSLNVSMLSGTVEAGIKIVPALTFWKLNLAGIEISGGAGLNAKFEAHWVLSSPAVVCTTAQKYLFLKLGIDDESLLGKTLAELKLKINYTIWDQDHSIYRKSMHLENLKVVEKCTQTKGTIKGTVKNTSGNALSGARINIYQNNQLIKTAFTNKNGQYTAGNINPGEFTIKCSAVDYKTKETGGHIDGGATKTFNCRLNAGSGRDDNNDFDEIQEDAPLRFEIANAASDANLTMQIQAFNYNGNLDVDNFNNFSSDENVDFVYDFGTNATTGSLYVPANHVDIGTAASGNGKRLVNVNNLNDARYYFIVIYENDYPEDQNNTIIAKSGAVLKIYKGNTLVQSIALSSDRVGSVCNVGFYDVQANKFSSRMTYWSW